MNHEAVDVDCEAVDRDAFAGAWVIDVGHEAVDGGSVIAGTHVMYVSGKVTDGDERAKGKGQGIALVNAKIELGALGGGCEVN